MKAEELRVGNYICKSESLYINIVTAISMFDGFRATPFKGCDIAQLDTEFKPIPLTEEWLTKFGFTTIDDDIMVHLKKWIYPSYGETYLEVDGLSDIYIVFKHPIRQALPLVKNETLYVHQLQNLFFGLTGEELKLAV